MEFEKLVKNLSDESKATLESAIASASSRSHYQIELEHWLEQALINEEPDIVGILKHFGVDLDRALQEVERSLESSKTGNDGFPKISPDVVRLLFEAWMLASSQFACVNVRPVHIFFAFLDNSTLKVKLAELVPSLVNLDSEEIRTQCEPVLNGSVEVEDSAHQGQGVMTRTPALDQFTTDLTKQAEDGKIDAILGRDDEIRQIIDVLCRRKQNNPILTGEAGVGKTAVVEGLALKIVQGQVPEALRGVQIRSLDLGLLQAGAGVKGEFENRLKNVIKEAQHSSAPVIMFIDEAHTLIGAGNQSGSGDAANLLKPALARGELRTIAATTWAEYKKYFESDAALTRRFQVIKVEEPSVEVATTMLRSAAPSFEKHHGIIVLDEAVSAAVTLSHRYIPGRQLPDKCVSLLDTACARVNLSQSTKPAKLVELEQNVKNIEFETARLQKEMQSGFDHSEMIIELEVKKVTLQERLESLQARWESELTLVDRIADVRRQIEQGNSAPVQQVMKGIVALENSMQAHCVQGEDDTSLKQELYSLRHELASVAGRSPLIHECVDEQVVAEVVADWTGIPVGRMQKDEIEGVLALESTLEQRVIGQNHGLKLISKTMQTARAKLGDPRRPLGVFMLVGPSGVGKTETALALAEQLYGSEKSLTVINMSEFKEEHKVSMLMGAPPGYVGYGEGGVLTEAVRRKPYSVVLLDEMEKAHPGVQDVFYQVFDKGSLRDGEGRDIDFKNTVIIMTSNTASSEIEQLCIDPETKPEPFELLEAIGPVLREAYKPAFLGRINVIPYYPLEEAELEKIARMQLDFVRARVKLNYGVELNLSPSVMEKIVSMCSQSDTGARRIASLVNDSMLPVLAEKILAAVALENNIESVVLDVNDEGEFFSEIIFNNEKTDDNKNKKTVTA